MKKKYRLDEQSFQGLVQSYRLTEIRELSSFNPDRTEERHVATFDKSDRELAESIVSFLNGGGNDKELIDRVVELEEKVDEQDRRLVRLASGIRELQTKPKNDPYSDLHQIPGGHT